MNIRILGAAAQDLIDGFRFYEMQEAGLGQYFLDSLFADVDSLLICQWPPALKLSSEYF